MRPALRNIARWVCRLHADVGAGQGSQLAVATHDRRPAVGAQREHLLAERILDAAPLPWPTTGQSRGIEGRWLVCTGHPAPEAALKIDAATLYARLSEGWAHDARPCQ